MPDKIIAGATIGDHSPLMIDQGGVLVTTANTNTPVAATAAVLTFAADANYRYKLEAVEWSLSVAPAAATQLKIEDGSGNVVWTVDVTAAGPGCIAFLPPLEGTVNTAMIVTLASGAGAVIGRVNARPTKTA